MGNAMKSAKLEAARLNARGGGGARSGLARPLPWEYRAAQSRQACPEEAQAPSLSPAKAGVLHPAAATLAEDGVPSVREELCGLAAPG